MLDTDWSAPFGARAISAAAIAAEKRLRARQRALREGQDGEGPASNEGAAADKWQLLRAATEAREALGLSDRAVVVLDALLSFHPGKTLEAARPQIVFPSNRELSLRARGMAEATLRRHLAALVEAGLVLRRDSPNGKRFRRRGGEGEAFGFDLSPLAMAAAQLFETAERVREQARARDGLRTAIALHRRDCARVIEAALGEGREGDFLAYAARLAALAPLRRGASQDALAAREGELLRLRAEVENTYLSSLSTQEMDGRDAENERLHQNSNTDPSELTGQEKSRRRTAHPDDAKLRQAERMPDLATVMRLCPDLADYARGPVRNLADFRAAADLARAALGVSPSAYQRAREVMGEDGAACVVGAMLQRAGEIRAPGGYLRELTSRAARGAFSIWPMLRALEARLE